MSLPGIDAFESMLDPTQVPNRLGILMKHLAGTAAKPLDWYNAIAGAGSRAELGAVAGGPKEAVKGVLTPGQSNETTHAAERRVGLPVHGQNEGLGANVMQGLEDFGTETLADPAFQGGVAASLAGAPEIGIPLDLFSLAARGAKAARLGERIENASPWARRFADWAIHEQGPVHRAATRAGQDVVRGHESAGRNVQSRQNAGYEDLVHQHADELDAGHVPPPVRQALLQRAYREGTAGVRRKVVKDGYVPTAEEAASKPLGILTNYRGVDYIPKQRLRPRLEEEANATPYRRIRQLAPKPGYNLPQKVGDESTPLSERVADRLAKGAYHEKYYSTRDKILSDLGLAPETSRPTETIKRFIKAMKEGDTDAAARYAALLAKQTQAAQKAAPEKVSRFLKPGVPLAPGTQIPQDIYDRLFGDIVRPNPGPLKDVADASREALFSVTALPHKKNISVLQTLGKAGLPGVVRGMQYARQLKKAEEFKPEEPNLFRYQQTSGVPEISPRRSGTYFSENEPHGHHYEKNEYQDPWHRSEASGFGFGGPHLISRVAKAKNPLDLTHLPGRTIGKTVAGIGTAKVLRPSKPTAKNFEKLWENRFPSNSFGRGSDERQLLRYLKAVGVPEQEARSLIREGSWASLDRIAAEMARRKGYDAIIHRGEGGREFFALDPTSHAAPMSEHPLQTRVKQLEAIGGTEHFVRKRQDLDEYGDDRTWFGKLGSPLLKKMGPAGRFLQNRPHNVGEALDRFDLGQRLALQDALAKRGVTGFKAGGQIRDTLGDYKSKTPLVDLLRNQGGAPFPQWHLGIVPKAIGKAITENPVGAHMFGRAEEDLNKDVAEPTLGADFHLGGPFDEGVQFWSPGMGKYLGSGSVTGGLGEAYRDAGYLGKGNLGGAASSLARTYAPLGGIAEDALGLSNFKPPVSPGLTVGSDLLGSYFTGEKKRTPAEQLRQSLRERLQWQGVPPKVIDTMMRKLQLTPRL